jgi:hypothetical protein
MFKNSKLNNFLKNTNCPFVVINVKYTKNNDSYKKDFFTPKGWTEWDYNESVEYYNNNKESLKNYNSIMINITKRFIVIDTDDKEADEYARNNLFSSIKNETFFNDIKTYSNKYYLLDNKKYETSKHYYFNVFHLEYSGITAKDIMTKAKFINDNDNKINIDVISDKIIENIENFSLEVYDIPKLPKKIYDLLPKKQEEYDEEEKDEEEEDEEEEDNDELYDQLEDALLNVDEKRAEVHNDWILTKFILKDLGEKFQPLFIQFSKRSEKHKHIKSSELIKEWMRPNKKNIKKATKATIFQWLKEDNPEYFKDFIEKYKLNKKSEYKNYEEQLKKWYNEQKEIFEKDNFLLTNPVKMINCPDEINKDFNYRSLEDVKKVYKWNHYITYEFINKRKKEKYNYFWDIWEKDATARKYKDLFFSPELPLEYKEYYNTFNGFAYDSDIIIKKLNKSVDAVFKHVFNNDTDYIYSWISHIIKNPHIKTDRAIVLYSKEHGVGKNTILEILKILFDRYWGQFSNIEDVEKKFNNHLVNKLIIYGDEIKPSKNKDLSDQLKNIITSKTINHEKKQIDAKTIKDYGNYMFTTNNELAFNIESGDRRFYMVECPNSKLDKTITKEIYNLLNNKEEMIKIFSFFKNYKSKVYTEINIDDVPMTDYKLRVIAQRLPGYIHFWYATSFRPEGIKINATSLYNIVKDYSQSKKLLSSFSQTLFGLELKKIGFKKFENKKKIVFYDIPKLEERKILLKNYNEKYYEYLGTDGLSDSDCFYDDIDDENAIEKINDLDK